MIHVMITVHMNSAKHCLDSRILIQRPKFTTAHRSEQCTVHEQCQALFGL
jgi:hypothetical protein